MYCNNCGKEVTDAMVYCPECGAPQKVAEPQPETIAEQQTEAVAEPQVEVAAEQQTETTTPQETPREAPAQYTEMPVQPQPQYQQPLYQQPVSQNVPVDNGGFAWGLLCFFFPVVGLILFLVWKDEKPKTAKAAGIGALVGVGAEVILTIVILVIYFVFLGVLMSSGF